MAIGEDVALNGRLIYLLLLHDVTTEVIQLEHKYTHKVMCWQNNFASER